MPGIRVILPETNNGPFPVNAGLLVAPTQLMFLHLAVLTLLMFTDNPVVGKELALKKTLSPGPGGAAADLWITPHRSESTCFADTTAQQRGISS